MMIESVVSVGRQIEIRAGGKEVPHWCWACLRRPIRQVIGSWGKVSFSCLWCLQASQNECGAVAWEMQCPGNWVKLHWCWDRQRRTWQAGHWAKVSHLVVTGGCRLPGMYAELWAKGVRPSRAGHSHCCWACSLYVLSLKFFWWPLSNFLLCTYIPNENHISEDSSLTFRNDNTKTYIFHVSLFVFSN